MKSALPTVAVVLGVLLLVVSLVWGLIFPASAGWTEEKSVRLGELKTRAHVLVGQVAAAQAKPSMHGGSNAAELEAEFQQVKTELTQLSDELDGRIESPKTTAAILRYAGIAFVVAGGLVVYAGRG
ncbi:hypothetical protein [Lacipirellula limnantheis]|uniref:Uncharacterized protein n=1 Tax=Lacipirellula limnantheis TaxID=2528024 RepID=A0A517TSA4_9BACT|nr:hypothetical protein [Lacipirellula limnantheis]QDT71253.1 hypothetical protein I41_04090 [Lacipirellula limnantheis]